MEYALAKKDEAEEERMYRLYMTDSIKAAFHINVRYVDLLPSNTPKAPQKTSDEIIFDISEKIKRLNNGCI